MYPVMTYRTSMILYFRFPAPFTVRLDVLVQRRDFLFFFIAVLFNYSHKGTIIFSDIVFLDFSETNLSIHALPVRILL